MKDEADPITAPSDEFIIVPSYQKATAVREAATRLGIGEGVDPTLIRAGEYAGRFAVPKRVLTAKQFERVKARFDGLLVVSLVKSEAWPPSEE